jgi:hypothetical protein
VVLGTAIPNALFLPKETSVYNTILFSENTTSNVLLGMKLAGGCLPCVPDHEEGRAQRREHHRLHVRRHRAQPGESEARCYHQPSPGWRCIRRGSKGTNQIPRAKFTLVRSFQI